MSDLTLDLNEADETGTVAPRKVEPRTTQPLVSIDISHAASGAIQLSTIKFGIVCPMASEADTAVRFVDAVLTHCRALGFGSVEFFPVLDRACKDNTRELLTEHAKANPELHVVWAPENRGVVDAYVSGYRAALAAGSDWILEIDAGFSHDPAEIPLFIERMRQGYDCVFGSRFCEGGEIVDTSVKRRFISKGGTILANFMLGTKLRDMTSGYELFSRKTLEWVLERGIHSRGPFFQTEIKTYCRNLKICEVPIHYQSASHAVGKSALKDSFKNLWRLYKLRRRGEL